MMDNPQPGLPGELAELLALAERQANAGQLAAAAAAYHKILTIKPDFAEVRNDLGNVLYGLGKLDEAVAQYQQALHLRPDLVQAHNNLANILAGQGMFAEAVDRYEQVLAHAPNFAEAHNNLANVLKVQGKFERALAGYAAAIALQPNYAEAHHNRAEIKTFRSGDPDLAALENLAVNSGRLPPDKMLYIHFALGKALEDVGEYRRAFEHWLTANALKRRQINYDQQAGQRMFQDIRQVFDAKLLDRFSATGDPSPAPIFILGMARSGSTLVEQILASHPAVYGAGELKGLNLVAHSVRGRDGRPIPFPDCAARLDAEGWRRLGQMYLSSLPPLPQGKTRITDKTPGNFWYVGLIRLILPNARIIHTTRDVVDTCVSCFSKLFATGQTYSYDLAELGRYYRWYSELMGHWRDVLPADVMLDVAYEDVVDNLVEQARRLVAFCGLPWDERCLDFHRSSRPITTASNVQVRRRFIPQLDGGARAITTLSSSRSWPK